MLISSWWIRKGRFPWYGEIVHYPADLDYDFYEGFTSRGWPVCTIRRGEILIEDGRFKGKRKSGRFLKCSLKPRKEA